MRTKLVLSISIVSLAGLVAACGGKAGASGLVGTWVIDKAQTKQEAAKQAKPDEDPKVAAGMIDAMTVEATFEAGGTWNATMTMPAPLGASKADGTWTLDGQNLTMALVHKDGKDAPDPTPDKGTFDGDRIRMDMGGGTIMVLQRK